MSWRAWPPHRPPALDRLEARSYSQTMTLVPPVPEPSARGEGDLKSAAARKQQELFHRLRDLGSVVVALSGGVDSSYLAWAAHRALGAFCARRDRGVPLLSEQSSRDGRTRRGRSWHRASLHRDPGDGERGVSRQPAGPMLPLQVRAVRRARPRARRTGLRFRGLWCEHRRH